MKRKHTNQSKRAKDINDRMSLFEQFQNMKYMKSEIKKEEILLKNESFI